MYHPCSLEGTASLLAISDAALPIRASTLGPQPDCSLKQTLRPPSNPPHAPKSSILCHTFVQALVSFLLLLNLSLFWSSAKRERCESCRRAMARAEADMALTPAGSPIPDPPYITAPDGTLHPEDDDDEEAQMLQGPVSTPCCQYRLYNVNLLSDCVVWQRAACSG